MSTQLELTEEELHENLRRARRKLARAKRRLGRRQPGSRGWERAQRELGNAERRIGGLQQLIASGKRRQ